jgi:hypothetical protein
MRFADLIAPCPVEAFAAEHFGRRALHARSGGAWARGFGWPALERLLDAAPGLHQAARFYRSDVGFVPATSTAEAIRHLRDGAALVVDDADRYDPWLADLADAVSAELDEPTRVNVYATTPASGGFPWHADTHDVHALQVSGRKRWRVAGPSVVDPLFHASLYPLPEPQAEPYLDVTLEPGDSLYVPRGHWHVAEAVDGPSLHLTLAVFHATGIDVAQQVVEALFASDVARRAFPLVVGSAVRDADDLPAAHRDHLAAVREALVAAASDPDLLRELRLARLRARTPRRAFALPAQLGAVGGDVVRPIGPARLSATDTSFDVDLPGRRLSLPRAAEPLVRRAFAGDDVAVDVLVASAGVPPSDARAWVDGLVAEGALRVVPAATSPLRR